ncbi:MAG: nuclear transport factor 2 family protein [Oceanococcus sp.]
MQTAKASPIAVAQHNKQAWLDLFADDAQVHDPVGSRSHAGGAALERFYDTFIAPNRIHFEVDYDIACSQTVVRDVVISTVMGGTPLQVDVPLYIRYEIVNQNGEPKVHRLFAHWELAPMMTQQVFRQGVFTGLLAVIKLSGTMLRHQGLGGALGFSRAFFGVGASAKNQCAALLNAVIQQDSKSIQKLLPTSDKVDWAGEPLDAAQLVKKLPNLHWEKMLAGGRQVSARLMHDSGRAVALFDMASNGKDIERLRIYANKA